MVVLLLPGCVTQKKCLQKFPPSVTRDSSFVQKIDIIPVALPGFSHNIEVPVVNCPDQLLADVKTSKLNQQIQILNGKLISLTDIKPDTIRVPVTETIIQTNEVKIPQPVKFIPPFYKWCRNFTIFILSGLLLFIGWKVRKLF